MKFVLATHNPKKLVELQKILSDFGVEVVTEADVGVDVEVEETGETFAENSLLKAKAVMEATGLPAIADDSGLCVDALGGGPGVYSARYGGEGLTDRDRYMLLLQNMRGQTTRAAHFSCCITAAFPNGDVLQAEGQSGTSHPWQGAGRARWQLGSGERGAPQGRWAPCVCRQVPLYL